MSTVALPVVFMAVYFGYEYLSRATRLSILFGDIEFYELIIPFALYADYRAFRQYRVNRTPWLAFSLIAGVAFSVVLVGYCLADDLDSVLWLFPAVMAFLLPAGYYASRWRPRRHNYNLFLRGTRGLLGEIPQSFPPEIAVSRPALASFALFLGRYYLISDYRLFRNSLTLKLPPVISGGFNQSFGTGANSWVSCSRNGICKAHLGEKDRRALKLAGDAATAAENDLARVMEEAIRHFLAGNRGAALARLQAEDDATLFAAALVRSKADRTRFAISAVSFIFLSVFFLKAFFMFPALRTLEREDARAALVKIVLHERQEFSLLVLDCDMLFPIEFLPENAREDYRNAIIRHLTEESYCCGTTTKEERVGHLVRYHEHVTFRAMDQGILREGDLSELGLNEEILRQALIRNESDLFDGVVRPDFFTKDGPHGKFKQIDFRGYPYTVACLKRLNCLDLVDRDWVVERFVSEQVLPGNPVRSEYPEFNRKKANGLFDFGRCGFEATFGAVWTLDMLDALDRIDKEACIDGIMRFYRGRGEFCSLRTNIWVLSDASNSFYALECLRMLGALDRLWDLNRWDLRPKVFDDGDDLASYELRDWALHLCVERIRTQQGITGH